MSIRFTPMEERILAVLSDGLEHSFDELFACLNDELQGANNLSVYLFRLREKLKLRGETIMSLRKGSGWAKPVYQHVRFLRSPNE